jgi:hypothetical protein
VVEQQLLNPREAFGIGAFDLSGLSVDLSDLSICLRDLLIEERLSLYQRQHRVFQRRLAVVPVFLPFPRSFSCWHKHLLLIVFPLSSLNIQFAHYLIIIASAPQPGKKAGTIALSQRPNKVGKRARKII